MCFSPEASFAAAALTAAAGAVSFVRMPAASYSGLALMPLVFAIQQFLEGLIWLRLAGAMSWPAPEYLANAFVAIAELGWPVLAPAALWMAEGSRRRRAMLATAASAGFALACFFLSRFLAAVHVPSDEAGRIVYRAVPVSCSVSVCDRIPEKYLSGVPAPDWILLPYAVIIIGSFLLSGQRPVRLVGIVICTGLLVSLVFYNHALISVWCFFAAFASLLIVRVIEKARQTARCTD